MAETVTCKECGKVEELHWGTYNELLKAQSLCFSCDHWMHYIENDPSNPNAVIIEGNHYIVCNEAAGGRSTSGFGGEKFIIEKIDGERIVTTNLWHQGRIPERFRDRLIDNARFIREGKDGNHPNQT